MSATVDAALGHFRILHRGENIFLDMRAAFGNQRSRT